MSKQEEFRKALLALQSKLSLYIEKRNVDHPIYKKYIALNQQILSITSDSPDTSSSEFAPDLSIPEVSTSPSEEEDQTCIITKIALLKPSEHLSARRAIAIKSFAVLQIETSTENCDLTATTATLNFADGGTEVVPLKNTNQQDKIWQASVDINFTGHTTMQGNNTPNVGIKIGDFVADLIYYLPNSNIDLSSSSKAKKSVQSFTWLSSNLYIDDKNAVLAVCPRLVVKTNKYGTYILSAQFKRELPKNPNIKEAKSRSLLLSSMSVSELDQLEKDYRKTHSIIYEIRSNFEYNSNILADLDDLYEGNSKGAIFDKAYRKKVRENQIILDSIKANERLLSEYLDVIYSALIKKSIPNSLLTQGEALLALIPTQEAILEPLEDEAEAYYTEEKTENTFDEWKITIERITKTYQTAQSDWDTLWIPFQKGIQDFEKNSPQAANNSHYIKWKESTFNTIHIYLDNDKATIYLISPIKDYLEKFEAVINQTGGDGKLEYSTGENLLSSDEKTRFTATPGGKTVTNNFSFEDVGKPLFDTTNGPEADDIKQGLIGDCYLMSALISLTKDNQNLIRKMIVPKGNKFIVTLHKEGVPVEVEVDKKLIVRKMNGYQNSMPASEALDDIWVPIIEKAYAKLFNDTPTDLGGNLMDIEGGDSSEALKALLGNRVKTPKNIYLNASGDIVQENPAETASNPIDLSSIDVNLLQRVLEAANKADYEIHVSSPDQYNGITLGDQDIIPIDNQNNFMSFKHAYSLINATNSTVTIRNPHGDSNEEQGLFSRQIKTDVTNLLNAIKAVDNGFSSTNFITSTIKNDMDAAIRAVNSNSLIKSRLGYINKDWEKLLKKMVVSNNNWNPKRNRAGYIKKITKKITALKNAIQSSADHKDKKQKLIDGFISKKIALSAAQTISYATLKQYFDRITISIIS